MFSLNRIKPLLCALVVSAGAGAASAPVATAAAGPYSISSTINLGQYPAVSPDAVAVDSSTDTIYVTDYLQSGVVWAIDGRTNAVTRKISVGGDPDAVAVDQSTDTIYVANYSDGTVSVIDGVTDAVTATVPVGADPEGVAVDESTDMVYVANFGSGDVAVIDGSTNAVTAEVRVDEAPQGVAVNEGTNEVYVGNVGTYDSTPYHAVSVIDGATNTVTATIDAGTNILDGAVNVAVDPSSNTVYVSNSNDENYSVLVIDGATNTVTATVPVGSSSPSDVAVDPSTNTAFVTPEGDDTMSVIDGASDTVTATIPGFTTPAAVADDPLTNTVYVVNAAGTLSVLTAPALPVTITGSQAYGSTPSFATTSAAPAGDAFTGNPTCTTVSNPPQGITPSLLGGTYTLGGCSGLSLTGPTAGSYTITYSGTFTVNTSTSTTVTSSANPSVSGQRVTYTAKVSAADARQPSGAVAFADGGNTIAGCGAAPLSNGVATCAVTYPVTAGSPHQITATYVPSATFLGSTSPVLGQTVNRAATKLTMKVGFGLQLKLSATLTRVFDAGPLAAKTVVFSAKLGTKTTTLCQATTNSSGVATCTTTLPIGTTALGANFAGDGDYLASSMRTTALL